MQSRAISTWEGDLLAGSGTTTLQSGVAGSLPVSWPSRTEAANGMTSPEELIAAAHAACFNMAFSNILAGADYESIHLETTATATFEKTDEGFRLTTMLLSVQGDIPGIDPEVFADLAEDAKAGCPVSNALKGNVEISVETTVV